MRRLADLGSCSFKRPAQHDLGNQVGRMPPDDLRAQNLVAIRGENAVISARVLAKVDGEQIHLG